MTDERDRVGAFYSRFGMAIDHEAEVERFRARLLSAWRAFGKAVSWGHYFELIELEFARFNGSIYTNGRYEAANNVDKWLSSKIPFPELLRRLNALLSAISAIPSAQQKNLMSDITRAIDLSPGINLRIEKLGDSYELFPAGLPLMDDGTVMTALEWLRAYPNVYSEFRIALKILAEGDAGSYRQAQDSLRLGLENLLKLLLKNNSPLEEQGRPLKAWLQLKGMQDDLRETIVAIMNLLFKHYQNAVVKHNNDAASGTQQEWSAFEVEYLVYQFATLMRVLIEASGKPDKFDLATDGTSSEPLNV